MSFGLSIGRFRAVASLVSRNSLKAKQNFWKQKMKSLWSWYEVHIRRRRTSSNTIKMQTIFVNSNLNIWNAREAITLCALGGLEEEKWLVPAKLIQIFTNRRNLFGYTAFRSWATAVRTGLHCRSKHCRSSFQGNNQANDRSWLLECGLATAFNSVRWDSQAIWTVFDRLIRCTCEKKNTSNRRRCVRADATFVNCLIRLWT